MLTSSNYDETQKKTNGGRNGYGAKLTNIFSAEFVIETADGKRQKKYKQVFSNNMAGKSQPAISKCKESENWTELTFKPDLAKIKMVHVESDVVGLMKKRVVDLAGCLGKTVKVELNKENLSIKSFADYHSLYLDSTDKNRGEPQPKIVEKVNACWEVCVSLFQKFSFVNSMATIKGGTHVEYVTGQITNYLVVIVNKKNKAANFKASAVKNHMWVFVNALIDNTAQTKRTLTLKQASFRSKFEVSDDFLKKVATKSGVVDSLLSWAEFKRKEELKKTDGKNSEGWITDVPKLDDANYAGKRPKSSQCTLILTEGDSAKTLVLAGIAVVGSDNFGVFPLRGQLLNVREASHEQIMDNAEIRYIKKFMGLKHGQEHKSANVKDLRYGHLIIMTDQWFPHRGAHDRFHPFLLAIIAESSSFLVEFFTPVIKATRGGRSLPFHSMPEYESWKESIGNAKGWIIKYYKGGKDHASSRYVYTRHSPITRFIFPKDDDDLPAYLNDDGQSIEPTWYMPTIPTVLVNGIEGIGTGWSSYVPNYNPRDIIANIRHLMNGEPMKFIDPWYRGFKGAIEKTATKENGVSYTGTGVLEEIDETTIRVTELPIRKWTQDYKEFLESMMAANDPLEFFLAVDSFLDNKSDTISMLGGEMEKPTCLSIESECEEEEMLDAKTETKENGWFSSMFSRLQTMAFLGFSKSTIFDKTAGGSCNFNGLHFGRAPVMLSCTDLKKLTAKPTQVVMKLRPPTFGLVCYAVLVISVSISSPL